MKILFRFITIILYLISSSCFANESSNLELIYQGKGKEVASYLRDEIRSNKLPDKLQDLFLVDILRSDIQDFLNDYIEFSPVVFSELEKKHKDLLDLTGNTEKENSIRNSYRNWLDFSATIVNWAFFLTNDRKKSWVPKVGEVESESLKTGVPNPIWTTILLFTEAKVYYVEKHYLEADKKAYDGLAHLLLVDPNTLGGQVVLSSAIEYFHETSADRRMSEILSKLIIEQQKTKNPIYFNPYTGIEILNFLNDVSVDSNLEVVKSPEKIQKTYPAIDNQEMRGWINPIDMAISTRAIQIYLNGDIDQAKKYLEENKRQNVSSFGYEAADGIINPEKNKFNIKLEKEIEVYLVSLKNKNDYGYEYEYASLFLSTLKSIRYKGLKDNRKSDEELKNSIRSLNWIANLNEHPPGSTLPALFRRNRILLDITLLLIHESGLANTEKSGAIETISNLSPLSSEFEFINAVDLISSTNDEYGKTLAIQFSNFRAKREQALKQTLKAYFETNSQSFKPFIDDFQGLMGLNEELDNLITYMHSQSLAKRKKQTDQLQVDKKSVLINIFCLETFCYTYKKFHDSIELNFLRKDLALNAKSNFLNAIKEGGDGKKESAPLSDFIIKTNHDVQGIENCNIVSSSEFSAFPVALLYVGDSNFIDLCKIRNYTSISHLNNSIASYSSKSKTKWALSIADPIIRSESEMASIDETYQMIRGTPSIGQLPELPETLSEAKAIVALNTDKSVLLSRENATKDHLFSSNLSDFKILSFSTHGLMAGELDRVQSPSILLSPSASGELLMTNEILDLNGAPSVVILAVCNGATLGINLESGEITSIANAFLMKGVDSIVTTLWPLNSITSTAIVENAFEQIKSGVSVSDAFQISSINYRRSNPDARIKDWGAFFTYGDSFEINKPLSPSEENIGFPVSLSIIGEEVNVIVNDNENYLIHVWDKKKLKRLRTINLFDLKKIKFITDKSSDFIGFRNEYIVYGKIQDGKPLELCHSDIGNNWNIVSIQYDKGVVYAALKNHRFFTKIVSINTKNIHSESCNYQSLSFDLESSDNRYDRTLIQIVNSKPTVFANRKSNSEKSWIRSITKNGLIDYCNYSWDIFWDELEKSSSTTLSFSKINLKGKVNINSGYSLPNLSFGRVNKIKFNDFCSTRSTIVDFEKIYNGKFYPLFANGSGPMFIGNYFSTSDLTIQTENFFLLSNSGKHTWKKLNHVNNSSLPIVTSVINGRKKFISNENTCLSSVGTIDGSEGYIVCPNNNGYRLMTLN